MLYSSCYHNSFAIPSDSFEMTASFSVKSLDHVVLTVKSIEATVRFYSENLGMKYEVFTSPKDSSIERHSLKFGHQKINLHLAGNEFEPKAKTALPGTADLVSWTWPLKYLATA